MGVVTGQDERRYKWVVKMEEIKFGQRLGAGAFGEVAHISDITNEKYQLVVN